MEKQPFTTEGIDRLIASLYALPQGELDSSIRELLTDYTGWIERHIDLSGKQCQQLQGLPADFLFSTQQQLALALQLRLPVRLEKEPAPQTRQHGEEGVGKMHGTTFAVEHPQEVGPELLLLRPAASGFTYRIWYEEHV